MHMGGNQWWKGMVFEATELHSSWSFSAYQVLCDTEEMLHLSEWVQPHLYNGDTINYLTELL